MNLVRRPVGGALVALALALAACGGPSVTASPQPTPAQTITPTPTPVVTPSPAPTAPSAVSEEVKQLVAATTQLGSARIDFGVGFVGSSQIGDGDALTGSGSFGSTTPLRAQMEMEGESAGVQKMEVVIDDELYYVRGAAFEAWAPNGEWIKVDTTSTHPNAVALAGAIGSQGDPWAALYFLYGETGPAITIGTEAIGGVDVRHLQFDVDLDLVPDRAPAAVRDQLVGQIAEFKGQGLGNVFKAEVWIDADDRIRRAEYNFAMPPLRGGGVMRVWYGFSDFGVEIDLPTIDPDDVVDIEDVDLS